MASFPSLKSTQHTSSFGTSSRFGMPKASGRTPGPGAYVGSELTGSQYSSATSASLPLSKKTTSTKPDFRRAAYVGQGSTFGQQVSSSRSSASASSFGTAHRPTMDRNPGPGSYSFSSSFARSVQKRDGVGAFGGSEDRFSSGGSLEQRTPGPHQAGLASCGGGHVLSDWRNAPHFSFSGNSCETRVSLGPSAQGSNWRSQGVVGRTSPGSHSHGIPHYGNELGRAPSASLKGPFSEPKPRVEPHAQTYTPLSLYWDGRQTLGKSAPEPRSLLVRKAVGRSPSSKLRHV